MQIESIRTQKKLSNLTDKAALQELARVCDIVAEKSSSDRALGTFLALRCAWNKILRSAK